MKKSFRFLIFIATLLPSMVVKAQFVNTENAKMETDTVGWMGNINAHISLSKYVEQITSVDVGVHFQFKTKKSQWILLGNVDFLKGAKSKYVDSRLIHLRYGFKMKRRLHWECFVQAESNVIAKLQSRVIAGTGPRLKIFSNKFIHLHIATHITYEREHELTTPETVSWDFRSSSYLSFIITPNDRVEFGSTTFYQPRLSNFADSRILNEESIKVKASKHFSLSVRWNFIHDRNPPGTIPESLYSLSTGVTYDL